MRIIYTIILIIGVPCLFVCVLIAGAWFNDLLERHFGKPPLILNIVTLAGWIWLLVYAAWDQAGKWVNK